MIFIWFEPFGGLAFFATTLHLAVLLVTPLFPAVVTFKICAICVSDVRAVPAACMAVMNADQEAGREVRSVLENSLFVIASPLLEGDTTVHTMVTCPSTVYLDFHSFCSLRECGCGTTQPIMRFYLPLRYINHSLAAITSVKYIHD